MGNFKYPITLVGPQGEITLDAEVDTGATYNLVPRPLLERIGVKPTRRAPFILADGRRVEYEMGSVTSRIDGLEETTICIFGEPDVEPLIGAVTLEVFLLGVDPVSHTLVPVAGSLRRCLTFIKEDPCGR